VPHKEPLACGRIVRLSDEGKDRVLVQKMQREEYGVSIVDVNPRVPQSQVPSTIVWHLEVSACILLRYRNRWRLRPNGKRQLEERRRKHDRREKHGREYSCQLHPSQNTIALSPI